MCISKDRQVTRFKSCFFVIAIFCLFIYNCGNPVGNGDSGRFTFRIADVGQGLAQFGVMDGRAIVWDMGPPNQYAAWRAAYTGLGTPRIEAVVISHSDNDHIGGLQHLDANINWAGIIITTPHEDTAKIRAGTADTWRERITFRFISAGDTLKSLNSVEIICIWPPKEIDTALIPLNSAMRNRYSLAFTVRHGHNKALVTSDIDADAMNSIAVQYTHSLRAQILIVPHHGSASSINRLFLSYASAEIAVISCARQNSYGHPAPAVIDEFAYRGTKMFYTYLDNTITFTSNGYYWGY